MSGLAQAHTRYGASVNATNHYAGFLATGHSLGVGLKASTSVLAGALAPPVQPTIRNNDSGCGLYLVLFTSIMFALIGVLGFVGATKSNDGAMFGGIFSIAALAGFVVAWYMHQSSQTSKSRSLVVYQNEMLRWEQAIERWDQLWYCDKCDRVYNPGTKLHVSSMEMNRLI